MREKKFWSAEVKVLDIIWTYSTLFLYTCHICRHSCLWNLVPPSGTVLDWRPHGHGQAKSFLFSLSVSVCLSLSPLSLPPPLSLSLSIYLYVCLNLSLSPSLFLFFFSVSLSPSHFPSSIMMIITEPGICRGNEDSRGNENRKSWKIFFHGKTKV